MEDRDPSAPADSCTECGAPLPPTGEACPRCRTIDAAAVPPQAPHTGPKRVAHYVILRELGAGGMGTVFEAFDEAMERKVALKVLSRRHAPSDKADLRFAQEAWIAGKLNHPNLVKVYERGAWEDLSFYAMEIVDGGSLADVLSNMRRWGRDDRLGLEFDSPGYVRWAIERVIAAARGLDYAHRSGVVHRDVKPMNLLLDRAQGTLKVADFGLAIDTEVTRMTSAGKALGTPVYMAPEQILGKQGEIGPPTDVYALGVTLFEMLTLELPYAGPTQQLYMSAVLSGAIRRASKLNRRVSRDLETVLRKAMEKDPKERYRMAGELGDELERVLAFRPILAVPPGRIEKVWKWARRKPVHATLIGFLVLAAPTFVFLTQRTVEQRRLSRQVSLRALEQRMLALHQRDEFSGLVGVASEILDLEPRHVRARYERAVSSMWLSKQLRGREADRSQQLERQALEDVSRLVGEHPRVPWPYQLRAFVLASLGRNDDAGAAPTLAQEHAPEALSEQDLILSSLTASAQGNDALAVDLLSRMIAERAGQVDAVKLRAAAYERLGRAEEAIQDYRLAAGLNPEDSLARYDLGVLLTRSGKLEDGARYLEGVEDLGGQAAEGRSDNLLARARAAVSLGRSQDALELFRRAEKEARDGLALRPDLPWLHVNLGASLLEQHRQLHPADRKLLWESMDHANEALGIWRDRKDPQSVTGYGAALSNLCDVLIEMSALDRALPVCREVTERAPTEATGFYNLAGVHARSGRTDDALAALERDVALGDRDWLYLGQDPWFATLRHDRRFRAILDRMKRDAAD